MLTNIENKLEDLFERIAKMPPEEVSAWLVRTRAHEHPLVRALETTPIFPSTCNSALSLSLSLPRMRTHSTVAL